MSLKKKEKNECLENKQKTGDIGIIEINEKLAFQGAVDRLKCY